jgi:hypothetical protein
MFCRGTHGSSTEAEAIGELSGGADGYDRRHGRERLTAEEEHNRQARNRREYQCSH